MNFSTISFGAKIPVAKCQVLDKRENKFINATVYEYDCKDLEDIYEVGDLDESWEFQDLYTSGMHKKFLYQKDNKGDTGLSYYCIKNSSDEMLGVCQTEERNDRLNIKLITTNHKDYKYAGQALIASLGKKLIDSNGKILGIRTALDDVCNFYSNACGFKPINKNEKTLGHNFEMQEGEIADFIKRTESKTQGKIINLNI